MNDPIEGSPLDIGKEPTRDSGIIEPCPSILGNKEISLLKDIATTRYIPSNILIILISAPFVILISAPFVIPISAPF